MGGCPNPGRDCDFSDQFEAHTNQVCQRRIGFPTGSNLREEYSAGSQEWKNDASDFR